MFGKMVLPACALLASCATDAQAPELPPGPPVTELLDRCEGRDGWADAGPPVRLYGNVYHVGTCGITVLLIATAEGHVIVDSGPVEAVPLVLANIRALGFAPGDVRWIVTSHEHHDHVGGVAALQAATGAMLAANEAASRQMQTGTYHPSDPQAGINDPFPAARVDRVMRDGEVLELGALRLTMHATPGHTPGSASWTWTTCGDGGCREVAYVDSITAVSAEGYRFSDHPDYVAQFRRALDKVAALRCDLLITPHPSASQLHERLAGDAPLFDEASCSNYARWGRGQLDARLAREAAGG